MSTTNTSTTTTRRKVTAETVATDSEHQLVDDLSTAAQSQTEDAQKLGDLTAWSFPGSALITRPDLTNVLYACALDQFMPSPIKPKTAISRALREMNDDDLVRPVEHSDDYIIYALVRERTVGAGTSAYLAYATDLTVLWNKKVSAAGGGIDAALQYNSRTAHAAIHPLVRKYLNHYTARDLADICLRVVYAHQAVKLRKNGGFYFVPRHHDEALANLRLFVAAFPGAHIGMIPCPPTAGEEDYIRFAVVESLASDLKKLTDDVREKEETARDAPGKQHGTGVNLGTVRKYQHLAVGLREKVQLYVDLLQVNAQGLLSALATLDMRLEALDVVNDPFAGLDG